MVHWLIGGLQWAAGLILILVVPLMLIIGTMVGIAFAVTEIGGGWLWLIIAWAVMTIPTLFVAQQFQKLIFKFL